jgi:large subunit ribosomal protein L4
VASLKKYNLDGVVVGEVSVDDQFLDVQANHQMIKDYIVAIRANMRQWSACTKTRSEVSHSTKKPHAQKGGGRSRQGSLVAPQYKGGGIVFGPKPKFDVHVKINKKQRRLANHYLLAEKIKAGNVILIDSTEVEAPKTKRIVSFMNTLNLSKRTLFLGEGNYAHFDLGEGATYSMSVTTTHHENFVRSLRNLPKVDFSLAANVNGYTLMLANSIVMTEDALHELMLQLTKV